MALRRLRSILRILAIASSAWLLAIGIVAGLGANLGAPNAPDRQPIGLVIAAAILGYIGIFWWSSRRGAASILADLLGGLLQVGGVVLFVLSVVALARDAHAATPLRCGLPVLSAGLTACIGLASCLAIGAMQAHGYLARRWRASLPPAPPRP
jgi:hypothetical protein